MNASQIVTENMWSIAKNEVVSKDATMTFVLQKRVLLKVTLLYGCEAWICDVKHKRKINVVGMR